MYTTSCRTINHAAFPRCCVTQDRGEDTLVFSFFLTIFKKRKRRFHSVSHPTWLLLRVTWHVTVEQRVVSTAKLMESRKSAIHLFFRSQSKTVKPCRLAFSCGKLQLHRVCLRFAFYLAGVHFYHIFQRSKLRVMPTCFITIFLANCQMERGVLSIY